MADAESLELKRIMVVDDSATVCEFYTVLLEEAGYAVTTATSGEDALRLARRQRPDLFISDIVMPGMDGFELLTRVRSDFAPPVPPVILCSGFDITESEALRRGAFIFLRKPIDPGDLLQTVKLALLGHLPDEVLVAAGRERATAARRRADQAAEAELSRIDLEALRQEATAAVEWIRSYFGFGATLVVILRQSRLEIQASAGDPELTAGLGLEGTLSYCTDVVETGSSLVLADAAAHPCFAAGTASLQTVRFFAGVPLVTPAGVAVGAICLADREKRRFEAEDLLILENLGRRGSLILQQLAAGGPAPDAAPQPPGCVSRPIFESLLTMELRLAGRAGGAIELAVVEPAGPDEDPHFWRALKAASRRERSAVSRFETGVLAIYTRDRDPVVAARELRGMLRLVDQFGRARGVGVAALFGDNMPPLGEHEFLQIATGAEVVSRESGGEILRIAIHRDPWPPGSEESPDRLRQNGASSSPIPSREA